MRIAIMQPTYLPWSGYFALMDQAEVFVLLDDVQFSHRSWQHRNRIMSQNGPLWLTLPVLTKGRRHQLINEAQLNNSEHWKRKHLKAIYVNYAQAQCLSQFEAWLNNAYDAHWSSLCNLNTAFIHDIADFLGINITFIQASALHTEGKKASKLINICRKLGADEYISPMGSFEYIEADNRFPDAGIRLLYQHFDHPQYQQSSKEFLSHLSVLDLMLNEGSNSLEIIRSGEREPYTSAEVHELKANEKRAGEGISYD